MVNESDGESDIDEGKDKVEDERNVIIHGVRIASNPEKGCTIRIGM